MADNGRRPFAEAKVNVRIGDPVETPARIIHPDSPDVYMSLGAPANLKCLAYGFPKPTVTW